jgi:hypothetical protein
MNVRIALAITSVAALCAVATASARTTSLNPCTLLSARQVAAVHVDTTCKTLRGKPNPYYSGSSASWGKFGGKGSVIVAVDKAKSHDYIALWEGAHKSGTSWNVGSWSRGTCVTSGLYCYVTFVVGSNVVTLQVTPPAAKPIVLPKPTKAMAKTIAAKLS